MLQKSREPTIYYNHPPLYIGKEGPHQHAGYGKLDLSRTTQHLLKQGVCPLFDPSEYAACYPGGRVAPL